MTTTRPSLRHALVASALLAVVVVFAQLVARGDAAVAPGAPGVPVVLPDIGVTASDVRLLGAASKGAPGEAWARGKVRTGQQILSGTEPIALGQSRGILLRHTDDTGWVAVGPPLALDGTPVPEVDPVVSRVSASGEVGLLLASSDTGGTVLLGNAASPVRALPAPADGPTGLGVTAGEKLVDGTRAAFAVGDGPVAYAGVLSSSATRENAVLRWRNGTWNRESVAIPSTGSFKIVALAVADDGAAWLLARVQGRGIALYARESDGVWRERAITGSGFENRDPGDGITALQPLESPAEPLTATSDGVWADGRLTTTEGTRTFTLFYDADARAVTSSYCDAVSASATALCAHSLGSELARTSGYRSYAWAGDGDGTRVITDPVGISGDRSVVRGTYLVLRNGAAQRNPGAGGTANDPVGGAFLAPDRGWLGGGGTAGADGGVLTTGTGAGVTEIRPDNPLVRLESWPVALRRPLTAVAPQPGASVGAVDAGALAVGADGSVARYTPAGGWKTEPLLDSSGVRATPLLRGVAWPEPARAYAVGDRGEMWLWRSETGLWERDEGAPLEFEGNLQSVAFQPDNPNRGYAVGRRGLILRFDKSWVPEAPPEGLAERDITSIAFAGAQAIAAAGADVLLNDGGTWRVDAEARKLLADAEGTAVAVAGLRDGGAVVAGQGIVLVRQDAASPWRRTTQPLGALTAVAAAAYRDAENRVRAVVSVTSQAPYPPPVDQSLLLDPDAPPPLFDVIPLPSAGFVLRETATGWRDEQRAAFRPSGPDLPLRADANLGFALDVRGEGWIVGGETGTAFSGNSGRRTQTASIVHYPPTGAAPPGAGAAVEPLAADRVRLAIGGHAACRASCWDLGAQQLGPDVNLVAARQRADELSAQPGGPKAFVYTGAREEPSSTGLSGPDATRFAQLSAGALGFYPALSAAEGTGGAAAIRGALTNGSTPFGFGALPDGIDVADIPGASGESGARTHYAFDVNVQAGKVRVIVIDNSLGSLAASDPQQNPLEPQLPWLRDALADAKRRGLASVVVGSRDLNPAAGGTNAASDADEVARALVDGGASAYFFDRPDENRTYRIPAGAPAERSIPSFGTGTLGYGLIAESFPSFGESGFLLAEIDAAQRDPATNRAPVFVSLVPVISELSVDALDGTIVRRSRTALFDALGRRPRGGIRDPGSDAGPDPYIKVPADICLAATCGQRIEPRVRFTSSRPDIGDFVRRDPQAGASRRAVLLGADDKPISDATSSLFCAFNAGTTTITISMGNLTFSQEVRVLSGSAQRPCGTRPLQNPPNAPNPQPNVQVADQPEAGADPEPPQITPPVLPPAAPVPAAPTPAAAPPAAAPVPPVTPLAPLPSLPPPPTVAASGFVPVIPPPPIQPLPRPTPPSGTASVRVFEEQREEEEAYEQSSASSRYQADEHTLSPGMTIGFVILAAASGSTIARHRRRRRGGPALAAIRAGRRR